MTVRRPEVGTAPVVGGEHHDRIIVDAQPLELGGEHPGRPVDGGDRASVGPVLALAQESVLDVDGQVDVHVREVEEEGPVAFSRRKRKASST